MRGSRKFSQGGVQIPRRGLTENFNMAKFHNLAILGGGGGGGGVQTPCPPPSGSAHEGIRKPSALTKNTGRGQNRKNLY